MARKQTRRSISLSREGYALLRKIAETEGVSSSGWVETRIRKHAQALGLGLSPEDLRTLSLFEPKRTSGDDIEALRKAAFG